jgi:hypothetical protein
MTYETASHGPGTGNRAKPPKRKQSSPSYRQLLSEDIQRLSSKAILTESEQMLLGRLTDVLIKELRAK